MNEYYNLIAERLENDTGFSCHCNPYKQKFILDKETMEYGGILWEQRNGRNCVVIRDAPRWARKGKDTSLVFYPEEEEDYQCLLRFIVDLYDGYSYHALSSSVWCKGEPSTWYQGKEASCFLLQNIQKAIGFPLKCLFSNLKARMSEWSDFYFVISLDKETRLRVMAHFIGGIQNTIRFDYTVKGVVFGTYEGCDRYAENIHICDIIYDVEDRFISFLPEQEPMRVLLQMLISHRATCERISLPKTKEWVLPPTNILQQMFPLT